MLKGLFKNSHPVVALLMLLVFVLSGALAGQIIGMMVIFLKYGFSTEVVKVILENLADYPSALREIQFFSSLGSFIFPAIILAYLLSDDYKNYLKIDVPVYFSMSMWTILSMIVALPLLNFIAYYNQQISFPEILKPVENLLREQESVNEGISLAMLSAENLWALILNIVVIGIFAAVGEEFIFRGVLQNILGRFIRNHHLVIWTAAIIFSAAHFQFFGFVPRMLIGAYFGYLIFYTKNMWMPVIAHFTHNFIIIISFWIFKDQPENLEEMDSLGIGSLWWVALISLALFVAIFIKIKRQSQLQNFSS